MEQGKTLIELLDESFYEKTKGKSMEDLNEIDHYLIRKSHDEIIEQYSENPLISKCVSMEKSISESVDELIAEDFGIKYLFGLRIPKLTEEKDAKYGKISELIPLKEYYGKASYLINISRDLRRSVFYTLMSGSLYYFLSQTPFQEIIPSLVAILPFMYAASRIQNNNERRRKLRKNAESLDASIKLCKLYHWKDRLDAIEN
ncbi:MAG: hypothetical protein NTV63_00200 [Candidatus Woesearchaeota archaeon]|nr:hypothetical protein [Candidatus Woesearchaeota archaeon]